ncbi:MAG: hypothetical protein KTR31_28950 [Myxococcales bacterium]|nr:hypothetical protein [Myxococcales bacterium]
MIALLLSGLAAFAAPTDEEVKGMVEAVYDRTLPMEAMCITRPELPAAFREVVVAGVRRGALGCSVVGVVTKDKLRKATSATAAIKASAWEELSAQERADHLKAYTEQVLLAFAQVQDDSSQARARGEGFEVTSTYIHRVKKSGYTALSEGRWRFDANGKVEEKSETPQRYWRTKLSVRPAKVTGTLTTDMVASTVNQRGAVVKRCFTRAWEKDPTLRGRVQLTWTVQEGKSANLGVIDNDSPPEELANCYAWRAVNQLEWPAEERGTVQFVFAVSRTDAEPPPLDD